MHIKLKNDKIKSNLKQTPENKYNLKYFMKSINKFKQIYNLL